MTETYVVTGAGATAKRTIQKDLLAKLDYVFDWTEWLATVGDTIASHTITVPTGLTLVSSTQNAGVIVAWLSGGTLGQTYKVTCHIVTVSTPAREDERSIYVKIIDR